VLVTHRCIRDPQFMQQHLDGLRAPHVAPINALVDDLVDPSGRGWVPYVAPVYGGIDARVLCILRDPGPKTQSEHSGSGFLCPENDDASAERFATLLDDARIPVSQASGICRHGRPMSARKPGCVRLAWSKRVLFPISVSSATRGGVACDR
jgi:hypothetical protein